MYLRLLPASLRRLCLLQLIVGDGDLRDLGKRTPGLQHLHVDPYSQGGRCGLQELPSLFPKLETLKLRALPRGTVMGSASALRSALPCN
ncbi:hypothetical protein AAFF_G00018430 [Aldrovandia affinis]|uniref:Uncharacterized protein n=1 Tax=Aldrovandia affinis TaxID=143900 RepID=A0AAD7VY61_9TELE|nr:hypothetical protein AAFF_G00018430 [Aldrovandia affinis]